jgi:hypothetical protein
MKVRKAFIPVSQAFPPTVKSVSSIRLEIDPVAAPNTHMMARRSLSIPRQSIGLYTWWKHYCLKTYSLVSP